MDEQAPLKLPKRRRVRQTVSLQTVWPCRRVRMTIRPGACQLAESGRAVAPSATRRERVPHGRVAYLAAEAASKSLAAIFLGCWQRLRELTRRTETRLRARPI
jgi:hypothetical protein